jgi:hypothetical protein
VASLVTMARPVLEATAVLLALAVARLATAAPVAWLALPERAAA